MKRFKEGDIVYWGSYTLVFKTKYLDINIHRLRNNSNMTIPSPRMDHTTDELYTDFFQELTWYEKLKYKVFKKI